MHTLQRTIDLNGDGKLEVVIKSAYYEGRGYDVFSHLNGRIKRVLSSHDGL